LKLIDEVLESTERMADIVPALDEVPEQDIVTMSFIKWAEKAEG